MISGIRMMPREQFLLIRTKPYLHDDQSMPEDVLQGLLSERNVIGDAEQLLTLEDTSQGDQANGFVVYEAVSGTNNDGADVVKLEPV